MKLTTIKLQRLKQGRLQIETAREAKIARARLSEIENGHVAPRPDELQRLARVLGVSASSLIDATVTQAASD